MKVNTINNNKINFNARLNIKGENFLTNRQLNILNGKAKNIGNDNDTISFTIGKVKKVTQIKIDYGFDEFNQFTRNLFASNNINGKQSKNSDLMWGIFENSGEAAPSKYSEINNVFSYMEKYLDTISK